MKLALFKSSLRTFLVRIIKIESLLVLVHLVALSISRVIHWHDTCNYVSDVECCYTRSEDAFMILAFISTIAFILTHATAIVLSVRAIMKNRKDEPMRLLLGDTLMVGIGMPVAIAMTFFVFRPAIRMSGLIEDAITFVVNVRR